MECLSPVQWADQLAALRPRGDAWRNGGADQLAGSVMGQFIAAAGVGFAETDARLCQMVDEFFCSTASETTDLWALEYALPDGCGPYDDPCAKVNAVGDTTTAYAIAAALRRGWTISITEVFIQASEDCGYGPRCYGAGIYGAVQGVAWDITVDIEASPAYVGTNAAFLTYGARLYADALTCGPEIESLICLIRLIAPAHADLVFVPIFAGGPASLDASSILPISTAGLTADGANPTAA